jgi:6-phosphogluconolactonase/glucosamine-6-phosphate isomerase/deaminase
MQVYKVGSPEIAIAPLSSSIKSALYLGPTLWLVPGGSNIPITIATMANIDDELSTNLTIALTDERFGQYDHPDSNWTQLNQAGFYPKKAKLISVLKPDNRDLNATVSTYNLELEAELELVSSVIGLFGMGEDGHIAGILPNSPAANELNTLVTGYESAPFNRITLTFAGIRRLSTAFLIAAGESKRNALDRLIHQDLSLREQPAQILKQLTEAYVYNDQMEGESR